MSTVHQNQTARVMFACRVADALEQHGMGAEHSRPEKVSAAMVIHDELHEWAAQNLRMGASSGDTEKQLKAGLKAVRNKLCKLSDAESQQRYGVPIMAIISLIPTLISWISMVVKWWRGDYE